MRDGSLCDFLDSVLDTASILESGDFGATLVFVIHDIDPSEAPVFVEVGPHFIRDP